jgi:glycerol-3-phosphate acyltransferase PlsY
VIQPLYLLACFLLGAIPTGYIAGRMLKGIDIRKEGSGNMGATNVLRVLGKGPGAAVLAIDLGKGAAAVTLLPLIFHQVGLLEVSGVWVIAGGLAAVLGHNYTPFLGFKGGKGVATSAGVFLGLAPVSMGATVMVFVVGVAMTRMVSVGSIAAATLLPVYILAFKEGGETPPHLGQVFWLAMLLALFIWVKHIPNIKRILAGTENKLGKKP